MTTDDDESTGAAGSEPRAPQPSGALSTDVAFDVLAHGRRRHVLRCLQTYGDRMALADLADEVAVREHGEPITDVPAETVKQVYLSLYHRHVPKLEDAGVVTYSQQRDAVALTERASELAPYLELTDE